MATWCRGWKASSNSLGRTSKPQVSVAIPAISLRCSQRRGGEGQPRGGAAGVVAPAVAAGPGELSGADHHDVAAADLGAGALQVDGPLEVFRGDGETVRQLAVVPPARAERAADVQQHAAGRRSGRGGLDAGDQVAFGGDDVAGGAAVPGLAVVEDVAEAVPLGGALQRHGDDVVGAAEAVREALVAAFGVHAGVGHGVHRVGASPPALLRAVGVERLGQREGLARLTRAAASMRLAASMKFRVPSTSSWPQRPQLLWDSAMARMLPSGSSRRMTGESVADSPVPVVVGAVSWLVTAGCLQ